VINLFIELLNSSFIYYIHYFYFYLIQSHNFRTQKVLNYFTFRQHSGEAIIIGIWATKYTAAFFSRDRIKLRSLLSHLVHGESDLYFLRYRVITLCSMSSWLKECFRDKITSKTKTWKHDRWKKEKRAGKGHKGGKLSSQSRGKSLTIRTCFIAISHYTLNHAERERERAAASLHTVCTQKKNKASLRPLCDRRILCFWDRFTPW